MSTRIAIVPEKEISRCVDCPFHSKETRLKYDFHFTKNGVWNYINSCDDIKMFKKQQDSVKKFKENWRIVESLTGKIIKKSRGCPE